MRVEDDVALALKAGAAVVANLLDRRGIKQALWEIDDDVRAELTETVGRLALAAVAPAIEAAALERAAVVVETHQAEVQQNINDNIAEVRVVQIKPSDNWPLIKARDWLKYIAAAIRALKETT